MDTKLLIDAIVQQTTVLIARLSTAAGMRAPLAHVADQVFIELAREIERQGVGRKVVADMFGMALRTYQKRTRRLGESASLRGRTLWEAVCEHIAQHPGIRRKQVLDRFRHDSADDVAAVLNDLVTSGLVYCSGRGLDTAYRAVSAAEQLGSERESQDALADLTWLAIYRNSGVRLSALPGLVPATAGQIRAAALRLIADGVVKSDGAEDPLLSAPNFVVSVASPRGWEAAVFDHFSTVVGAIAAKVEGGPGSSGRDLVGGATFSFDVYPGHPFEERVIGLLGRMRVEVDALWDEVSAYNRAHPVTDETKSKVSFYFGQKVDDAGEPKT